MHKANSTTQYVPGRQGVAAGRIPKLFTHFFDIHFLEEKGVARFRDMALREMRIATRIAILLSDMVLVPAASYYESRFCKAVLDEFDPEIFHTFISLVASTSNLDEFLDDKRSQYNENQPQGTVYRAAGIQQQFPWRQRTRGATADIISDWNSAIVSGRMDNVFASIKPYLTVGYEKRWEALPTMLEGSAFIVENAIPLLFNKTLEDVPLSVRNRFHNIVNKSYFRSHAKDLEAAVFQNMVWLASSETIPSGDPGNDINYRIVEKLCVKQNLLNEILSASGHKLLSLRDDTRISAIWAESHGSTVQDPKFIYNRAATIDSTSTSQARMTKPNQIPRILIVTALAKERAAVMATFDHYRKRGAESDANFYIEGTYYVNGNKDSPRTVLLATASDMGKAAATAVATNALRSFPQVEHILMVGIAGGCPNPTHPDEHIRLGDIVASGEAGIIEYDDVKRTHEGTEFRGPPRKPSYQMIQVLNSLLAELAIGKKPWEAHMDAAADKLRQNANSDRPDPSTDLLYEGDIRIDHPADPQRDPTRPRLFSGAIGTSDTLLKDPSLRDRLRDQFRVRAIEMEGSGIEVAGWANNKDVFIIRGICDYCDPHKGDVWHAYAALAAAGFARAAIEEMPKEWFP